MFRIVEAVAENDIVLECIGVFTDEGLRKTS
jgi:hypothetical protein